MFSIACAAVPHAFASSAAYLKFSALLATRSFDALAVVQRVHSYSAATARGIGKCVPVVIPSRVASLAGSSIT